MPLEAPILDTRSFEDLVAEARRRIPRYAPQWTDFYRQGQVYRAPSQAGPGNDINAGSPGFQKAPTRGPTSLVARCFLRAEYQLSDAHARSMRTPTLPRKQFERLPALPKPRLSITI